MKTCKLTALVVQFVFYSEYKETVCVFLQFKNTKVLLCKPSKYKQSPTDMRRLSAKMAPLILAVLS